MQRTNQKEHLKLVLARERRRRELTQEEVAEAVGASLRNYQRWEQGEVYPQPYYLQRLREYFGPCIGELPALPSIDSETPSMQISGFSARLPDRSSSVSMYMIERAMRI